MRFVTREVSSCSRRSGGNLGAMQEHLRHADISDDYDRHGRKTFAEDIDENRLVAPAGFEPASRS